jgi:lipopolysaccharide/colanic/teichoic acid biosynthesis glycosyltransferase
MGSFLMKRILDISISMTALVLASPFLLMIALAVKLESWQGGTTGPIFYKAARIGRKGRTFNCFKFRTMVPNADRLKADLEHMNERKGVLFKIVNDPRITRVGRMLRKYSLDELPQFYNVLRGDMSLVGPRPPIASEVEQYELAHLRRLDVLPGITGLWQVEARQHLAGHGLRGELELLAGPEDSGADDWGRVFGDGLVEGRFDSTCRFQPDFNGFLKVSEGKVFGFALQVIANTGQIDHEGYVSRRNLSTARQPTRF